MTLFRRSSETHVVRVRNLVWLGKTTAEIGRWSTARRCFRRALELDPRCEEAWLWQAGLADNREQALVYLDRALAINPNSGRAKAGIHWARRHLASVTTKRRPVSKTFCSQLAVRRLILCGLLMVAITILLVVVGRQQGITSSLTLSPLVGVIDSEAVFPSPAPTMRESPIAGAVVSTAPMVSFADTNSVALPTVTPIAPPTFVEPAMPPLSATPVASLPAGPEATLAGLATLGEGNKEKRIEIDLSAQTLVAYEGDAPIFIALVSTGTTWTPTPVGQFRIYRKLLKQDISGPGYYLADVPYVQYFFGAYALHGAYWHDDFGRTVSHGCVNLTVEDAQWLFNWTEPTLAPGEFEVQSTVSIPGTLVVVRE